MSEVKRYSVWNDKSVHQDSAGAYVEYVDHCAIVASTTALLRAENEALQAKCRSYADQANCWMSVALIACPRGKTIDPMNPERTGHYVKQHLNELKERIATLEASLVQLREDAANAALCAELPEGYEWGEEAMEQFDFGTECAANAVRALPLPERAEGIKRVLEAAIRLLRADNAVDNSDGVDQDGATYGELYDELCRASLDHLKAVRALEGENK